MLATQLHSPPLAATGSGVLRVTTGSRLHFGMFSFGRPDVRQFGGIGAMIARPGIRLAVRPAERLEAVGPLAERTLAFARRAAAGWGWPGSRIAGSKSSRPRGTCRPGRDAARFGRRGGDSCTGPSAACEPAELARGSAGASDRRSARMASPSADCSWKREMRQPANCRR